MTQCEHCGFAPLAYAEMRRQRDALLAAAKALIERYPPIERGTFFVVAARAEAWMQLEAAVKEVENA